MDIHEWIREHPSEDNVVPEELLRIPLHMAIAPNGESAAIDVQELLALLIEFKDVPRSGSPIDRTKPGSGLVYVCVTDTEGIGIPNLRKLEFHSSTFEREISFCASGNAGMVILDGHHFSYLSRERINKLHVNSGVATASSVDPDSIERYEMPEFTSDEKNKLTAIISRYADWLESGVFSLEVFTDGRVMHALDLILKPGVDVENFPQQELHALLSDVKRPFVLGIARASIDPLVELGLPHFTITDGRTNFVWPDDPLNRVRSAERN